MDWMALNDSKNNRTACLKSDLMSSYDQKHLRAHTMQELLTTTTMQPYFAWDRFRILLSIKVYILLGACRAEEPKTTL